MRQLKISDGVYNVVQESDLLRQLVDSEPDIWHAIAKWFKERKMKTIYSRFSSVKNMKIDQAAKVISMLFFNDKQEIDEIVLTVDRALTDKFWSQNLQTITTIRNRCRDGMTKYEHILKRILEDSAEPLKEMRRTNEFLELL